MKMAVRVRVVYAPAEYLFGEEVSSEVAEEGELINIFWHPIDGPHAAYVSEYGTLETVKLAKVEVLKGE